MNGKLPGVHERFPVRDLEVEVVDEGLDHDACVELQDALGGQG